MLRRAHTGSRRAWFPSSSSCRAELAGDAGDEGAPADRVGILASLVGHVHGVEGQADVLEERQVLERLRDPEIERVRRVRLLTRVGEGDEARAASLRNHAGAPAEAA